MRRNQPTPPFDVDTDDVTQQFWGASKSWVSAEHATTVRVRPEQPAADTTGSLRAIRDGFAALRPQTSANATGEINRQRQHGTPRPVPPATEADRRREATLGELAAGRSAASGWLDDELLDDGHFHAASQGRRVAREPEAEYDVPLTPVQPLVERLGLGAVDPLLLRAGALVLAMILLVPVMLSLRPDHDDSLPGEVVETPQQVVAGAAPTAVEVPSSGPTAVAASTATEPATVLAATPSPTPADVVGNGEQVTDATATQAAPASGPEARLTDSADDVVDAAAAAVDVAAERIVPACPQTYTAAPGDSWYRIAEAAGVSPSELLAENTATTDTVILPGDDICLPEGATMPTPPSTVAPTVPEPAAEPTPTTAPTTTAAAPTTTTAPVANLSRSEVQELIRQTWPEDEVDKALAVAKRESNFIATADNGWCCYGVFQIYWTVHRGWLDEYGITQRSDLFDGRKNIAAAYAMWQRSGWGPWGG